MKKESKSQDAAPLRLRFALAFALGMHFVLYILGLLVLHSARPSAQVESNPSLLEMGEVVISKTSSSNSRSNSKKMQSSAAVAPVAENKVGLSHLPAVGARDSITLEGSEVSTGKYAASSFAANPKPEYPNLSRLRGEEGRVLVQIRVLASGGHPVEVKLIESSGFSRLDEATLAVVRTWRLLPFAGKEFLEFNVPFRFLLEGE